VDYLHRHPEIETHLSGGASQRFLTTDHTEGFDQLAQIFLGHAVESEKVSL
jgi:glutamate racemase